jgi:hypothetical protein
MDVFEFAANYTHFGDDELLCLWAERNTLVPEAVMALDSELQMRGLKKQNATRVKKRRDVLLAREEKGPTLGEQVAAAKYERNMRHFVGWEEPEFYSRYGGRDIRNTFAYIRHKYRVWNAFRDHTGHWPVFSICFHFLSWIAVFFFGVVAFFWAADRKWEGRWSFVAVVGVVGCVLVALGLRDLGARLMRKLDWKRYGS